MRSEDFKTHQLRLWQRLLHRPLAGGEGQSPQEPHPLPQSSGLRDSVIAVSTPAIFGNSNTVANTWHGAHAAICSCALIAVKTARRSAGRFEYRRLTS